MFGFQAQRHCGSIEFLGRWVTASQYTSYSAIYPKAFSSAFACAMMMHRDHLTDADTISRVATDYAKMFFDEIPSIEVAKAEANAAIESNSFCLQAFVLWFDELVYPFSL